MDRNTLLAFFLISLVLIFTPKYIELISGKNKTEERSFLNNETGTDTLRTVKNSQFEDLDFSLSEEDVVKNENSEVEFTTVIEKNLL